MTVRNRRFSKNERLKSRKEISRIFKNGIFLYSENFSLGYSVSRSENNKFTVAVPKRNIKSAVARNRIKRLLREAYRKNKFIIYEKTGKSFNILLIFRQKKALTYAAAEQELVMLLKKMLNKAGI
ncbi:MAG: ribonuclease P protein component [Chlorobi bacterium]|nr:ribonuclease P protein component [Chlorobiota bacterium]